MNNEENILLDEEQPNIDFIMQAVDMAQAEGTPPEQILTPDELAIYQEYMLANKPMQSGHYDNLVDIIDDSKIKRLAQEVIDWVRWDEESRKEWSRREKEGIRLLGLSDRTDVSERFKGASTVTHPLLIEAVTQFHSRALAEIWPPEGPVKAITLGDKDTEKAMQAQRVEDYMNFQYTEEMPGAFEEEDMMLFRLPISGSCFKKVYYDPLCKKIVSRLIEPADFIAPFSASDLSTAPRYTHRYRQHHNEVKKLIAKGFYADVELPESVNESAEYPEVLDEIDNIEGRERISQDDNRHTILECCAELSLEDEYEFSVPYLIWIDRDEQKVLRVQRNWRPMDDLMKKIVSVAHYKFKPGLGFYGYGLLHLIGGLAQSSTGSLQALLDSAAFSNMQGGYRTRDSRVKGGDTPIAPGEWREVDISAEELNKAFFTLPYKEPSAVLYNLLGYLDDRGQRIVGTNDLMSGDANPNAPVGTTLALIEQGGKSFADILRRLHKGHRDEFKILSELNSYYIPDDGYPYYTDSGSKMIMASDFDDRVDVIPVSDPNIISNSQRIIQAQAVVDLATNHPGEVDMNAALRMMLEAIRVTNVDELLQSNEGVKQNQEQIAQLEIQLKQAEVAKLQAEKELTEARVTESVLRGMFSAIQAASLIAQNPAIAPISQELFSSAGGKDYNGSPLVSMPAQAQQPIAVPQNTSPNYPAIPESPEQGANAGIETMRNETLQ